METPSAPPLPSDEWDNGDNGHRNSNNNNNANLLVIGREVEMSRMHQGNAINPFSASSYSKNEYSLLSEIPAVTAIPITDDIDSHPMLLPHPNNNVDNYGYNTNAINPIHAPLGPTAGFDHSDVDPALESANNVNSDHVPLIPSKFSDSFLWIRICNGILSILCFVEGIQAAMLVSYSSEGAAIGTSVMAFLGFVTAAYFAVSPMSTYMDYISASSINVVCSLIGIACAITSFVRLSTLQACISGDNSAFFPYQFYGNYQYYEDTIECATQNAFAWDDCNCVNDVSTECLVHSSCTGTNCCQFMLTHSPSLASSVLCFALIHIIAAVILGLMFYLLVKDEDVEASWTVWNNGNPRPHFVYSPSSGGSSFNRRRNNNFFFLGGGSFFGNHGNNNYYGGGGSGRSRNPGFFSGTTHHHHHHVGGGNAFGRVFGGGGHHHHHGRR